MISHVVCDTPWAADSQCYVLTQNNQSNGTPGGLFVKTFTGSWILRRGGWGTKNGMIYNFGSEWRFSSRWSDNQDLYPVSKGLPSGFNWLKLHINPTDSQEMVLFGTKDSLDTMMVSKWGSPTESYFTWDGSDRRACCYVTWDGGSSWDPMYVLTSVINGWSAQAWAEESKLINAGAYEAYANGCIFALVDEDGWEDSNGTLDPTLPLVYTSAGTVGRLRTYTGDGVIRKANEVLGITYCTDEPTSSEGVSISFGLEWYGSDVHFNALGAPFVDSWVPENTWEEGSEGSSDPYWIGRFSNPGTKDFPRVDYWGNDCSRIYRLFPSSWEGWGMGAGKWGEIYGPMRGSGLDGSWNWSGYVPPVDGVYQFDISITFSILNWLEEIGRIFEYRSPTEHPYPNQKKGTKYVYKPYDESQVVVPGDVVQMLPGVYTMIGDEGEESIVPFHVNEYYHSSYSYWHKSFTPYFLNSPIMTFKASDYKIAFNKVKVDISIIIPMTTHQIFTCHSRYVNDGTTLTYPGGQWPKYHSEIGESSWETLYNLPFSQWYTLCPKFYYQEGRFIRGDSSGGGGGTLTVTQLA
jgi:hypothetical protein